MELKLDSNISKGIRRSVDVALHAQQKGTLNKDALIETLEIYALLSNLEDGKVALTKKLKNAELLIDKIDSK